MRAFVFGPIPDIHPFFLIYYYYFIFTLLNWREKGICTVLYITASNLGSLFYSYLYSFRVRENSSRENFSRCFIITARICWAWPIGSPVAARGPVSSFTRGFGAAKLLALSRTQLSFPSVQLAYLDTSSAAVKKRSVNRNEKPDALWGAIFEAMLTKRIAEHLSTYFWSFSYSRSKSLSTCREKQNAHMQRDVRFKGACRQTALVFHARL